MHNQSHLESGSQPDDRSGSAIPDLLAKRSLIIASNRGPITFHTGENGLVQSTRGSGGLVTALQGIVQQAEAHWISCAQSEEDRRWGQGWAPAGETGEKLWLEFLQPSAQAYDGYYSSIANPLLWFLQHSMWDIFLEPTIDRKVWGHWENGYVAVNMLFAEAIARQINAAPRQALVMLQDYHLYLAPMFIRYKLRPRARYTLTHFIHIPWPGAEAWGLLPTRMRRAILEGLCAVDLLGFQTREDGLNFIRSVESHLPGAHVNYKRGRVWFRNHATHVRDFPISVDVNALRKAATSPEVDEYRRQFVRMQGNNQIIMRIDRIEPSKNIVRGFQAFDELLDLHPEHIGKVRFLAMLVPSRLEVEGYGSYLDKVMGIVGQVNAKYGQADWEPVRVLVGENYLRAVAAMQVYNVLLVNSIADGMNLVAKEGPIVNECDGVLILSERTGAYQQLERGAMIVCPLDVYGMAEAMHRALVMPAAERAARAGQLKQTVEQEDIVDWLRRQIETIAGLEL